MANKEIYLDNSATTKPTKNVVRAMLKCLEDDYGNPSSLHAMGLAAEKILKNSRETVARALNCSAQEIVFTSGGTEANNLAIMGVASLNKNKNSRLVTSTIEHPSVLNVFNGLEQMGAKVCYLPVDQRGVVDLHSLKEVIDKDTSLVSIMYVNNEIGTIQPIEEIGRIIKQISPNTLFHVDGIQAFGKLDIDLKNMPYVDLFSISAHKIHGPKGVGALYIKKGTKLSGMMMGGGQEFDLRPGTENMPGIAGFAQAIVDMALLKEKHPNKLYMLKERLTKGILDTIDDCRLNGPSVKEGAPHIVNISFNDIRGEVLVHALEKYGVFVSTGAACSSRRARISHVLRAIGLIDSFAIGAIRFSFSLFNEMEEIDYTINIVKQIVEQLRKFIRR
ncbi:MAG TPA: cysteine desulfurase [Clostridiales bacterium]|nr:cysteine desulfurase [Clostridiales bacterium]